MKMLYIATLIILSMMGFGSYWVLQSQSTQIVNGLLMWNLPWFIPLILWWIIGRDFGEVK